MILSPPALSFFFFFLKFPNLFFDSCGCYYCWVSFFSFAASYSAYLSSYWTFLENSSFFAGCFFSSTGFFAGSYFYTGGSSGCSTNFLVTGTGWSWGFFSLAADGGLSIFFFSGYFFFTYSYSSSAPPPKTFFTNGSEFLPLAAIL